MVFIFGKACLTINHKRVEKLGLRNIFECLWIAFRSVTIFDGVDITFAFGAAMHAARVFFIFFKIQEAYYAAMNTGGNRLCSHILSL